jgi:hypothetical protein
MKEEKDEQLWQQAKSRADFKTHLATYLIVNGMLWLAWLVTGGINSYPWPIWPTLGWGIGVLLNYLSVYKFTNTVEREYEKLKGTK